MKPTLKTYATFVFSPAFILESKGREQHLVEEETTTALAPGTLDRVLKQYEEVKVADRNLSTLEVPKGALYFSFYDRLTITVPWERKRVKLYSEPINQSGMYFLENEGEFFHRTGLEGNSWPDLHPEWRKQLLKLMDRYDSSHIIQVQTGGGWEIEENFILGPNDIIVGPNQVKMVDTNIPWKRK